MVTETAAGLFGLEDQVSRRGARRGARTGTPGCPADRRRVWLRRLSPVLLAIVLLLAGAGPASAHAGLVVSDPPAGAVLAGGPGSVGLRFTEVVEPGQSEIVVAGPDRRRLDGVRARRDPQDASRLVAALPAGLDRGTYTVRWRVLSIDGHPTDGGFRFAIGAPTLPLAGGLGGSGSGPTALGGAGRALTDVGLLALVGLAAFPWLVLRPAVRGLPAQHVDSTRAQVLLRLLPWQLGAVGFAAVGSLLLLLDTTAQARGFAPSAVAGHLGDVGALLTGSRPGRLFGVRLFGLVVVLVALLLQRRKATRGGGSGIALAALPVLLLLTVSLASHASAAAVDAPLAVVMDWSHLIAAGVWTGGLLALALAALPAARDLMRRDQSAAADTAAALTRSFASAAQACMVAVLVTGAYPALVHLDRLADLRASWGVELVVKLALWVTVLLVATVNTFSIVPRMSERAASVSARLVACGDLASAVRVELVLAGALLSVAAVLAGTAPPDQVV